MKELVARDQVRLGAARCFQLAVNGMRYRFFRSGVTIAILALAVAFLAHMVGFGILERETRASAESELEATRKLGRAITRLGNADSRATILETLARREPAAIREYAAWSGASPDEMKRAHELARRRLELSAYLDGLPAASRAVVLGELSGRDLLDAIDTREEALGLATRLRGLGHGALLGSDAELVRLLTDGRAELDRLAARIESGHRQAVGALSAAYPDKTRLELVENPPPDFFARVRAEKFEVEDVHALADFARRTRALSAVEQALLEPEIRSRLARATGLAPSEIELSTVASYVRKRESNAASVAEVLRGAGARGLDGPRLYDLLSRYERERRLDRASSGYVPNPSAFFGLGARTQWLIVLSFLVCVVGVANAMLMSVTERFTEIATMKCLGALDGFVMTMFVFEALIQGAVGGVVGVVLGVLLAVVRMLFEYGPIAGAAFGAVGEMGSAALLALVIGVLLAAVAAVGPSFVAARLAPMEAMRVD